ncbi:hypothetical protein [Roseibacillus persicicus]|uniref:hypothetical protein n=1 Tax=Roseibacillus persicicus TaxID=454148 RepID=UPI00280FAC1D|nr:hypothetical protein [Roseibacillus persicicus]MDQ8191332.1 hypothetical protein [Roseibacillus persicicus]
MNKRLAILLPLLLPGLSFARDWEFSGSIENTLWLSNEIPPAFLEFDEGYLYDPSLSLSLDYQPDPRFFLHATATYDQGFDPGTKTDGELRLDALILRYQPFGDNTLNLQAGKFPTFVGNWTPNHNYYDDPFLLAPLPYAAINGINTQNPNDHSPSAIEARASADTPNIHRAKENWSSLIWGPSYSNGFAAFGSTEHWDYAFEVKNTALGSNPDEWHLGEGDFAEPTFSGRIGYRPDAAWAFGLSGSYGPYLDADASDKWAPGISRDDFYQTLIGLDARWAHHDWILSGEAFYANYNALGEDLQSFSYYLQARYKAAPGFWLAGRFGQTFSNEVTVPSGSEEPWSPDLLRAELAAGWRITPDLLLKGQYAYTLVTNNLSYPNKNLFALSLGYRF